MLDLGRINRDFKAVRPWVLTSAVREIRGPVVIARRLPVPVGTTVQFEIPSAPPDVPSTGSPACRLGEVTGFNDHSSFIAPYSSPHLIAPDTRITVLPGTEHLIAGPALLGTVLDSRGRVVSRLSQPGERFLPLPLQTIQRRCAPPCPLRRQPADRLCETGIRVLDGFVTLACGQRIAVFAEAGVGKSTLLSAVARNAAVDVAVIALVGERGREVSSFITQSLDPAVYPRSVVVQATSDQPAICRINAALTATALAEYFREAGLAVLLLFDSLTRFVRACREAGLAAGEVPVRRGYPPSVYSALPALIERAGTGAAGSITAFYTVLLSSDLDEDPMVDEIKGLTDGHIMMRRELADSGCHPAIDPLRSLSRLQPALITSEQQRVLFRLRSALARAERDRELAALGGAVDPELARAFKIEERLRRSLCQPPGERVPFSTTIDELMQIDGAG